MSIHARQLKVKEGVGIRNVTVECLSDTGKEKGFQCNLCQFFTPSEVYLHDHMVKFHKQNSSERQAVGEGRSRDDQEVWSASEVLMLLCENSEPISRDELALEAKPSRSSKHRVTSNVEDMSDAVVFMMSDTCDEQEAWNPEEEEVKMPEEGNNSELQSATDLLMMLCDETG